VETKRSFAMACKQRMAHAWSRLGLHVIISGQARPTAPGTLDNAASTQNAAKMCFATAVYEARMHPAREHCQGLNKRKDVHVPIRCADVRLVDSSIARGSHVHSGTGMGRVLARTTPNVETLTDLLLWK
jgi:hypothetical protein